MQTNTETNFASMRGSFRPHLFDFLFNQFRRFAPGEVEINLFCRQLLGDI